MSVGGSIKFEVFMKMVDLTSVEMINNYSSELIADDGWKDHDSLLAGSLDKTKAIM